MLFRSKLTDVLEATASNNVTIKATVFIDTVAKKLNKIEAGTATEGETYLGVISFDYNNYANAEIDNKWQISAQTANIAKIAVAITEFETALKTKYKLV